MLRLRVTRREEPDVDRLVELLLNIAEGRHHAYLAGDPDPYGLPVPGTVHGLDGVGATRENVANATVRTATDSTQAAKAPLRATSGYSR